MEIKISAVIVTYKNRHGYLSSLLNDLLNIGLYKIIVVDNNSLAESKTVIKQYENSNKNRIHVVYLEKNFGTAIAFTKGMIKAKELESEFIWLLDDDLIIQKDTLEELLIVWNTIGVSHKEESVILLSNRILKKIYSEAFIRKDPSLIIGRKNQFRSFHLFHIIERISLRLIKKTLPYEDNKNYTNNDPIYGNLMAACYGGMFFHRKLIDRIGYPDEKFVVYMDDFDYSYRNVQNGGLIYFVPKSIVRDQEESWNQKRSLAIVQIAKNRNYSSLYYSIRNRVYFECKYFVDNMFVYFLNLFIYSFLVTLISIINLKIKNVIVYYHAVYDGLMKRMGLNDKYLL